MAGVEEKLGRDVYIADETEGIIPRASKLVTIILNIYMYEIKLSSIPVAGNGAKTGIILCESLIHRNLQRTVI
jgi:hypothetical protein